MCISSVCFAFEIDFAQFKSDQRMSFSGEAALSSHRQSFLRRAGFLGGFLPNTSCLFNILAGFIRLMELLSDLMWSAKSSPNSKAEPGCTLFANLHREG